MPYGLVNSGSTFIRLVEEVGRGMMLEVMLAYIDDSLIPGREAPQVLERLAKVLERLEAADLKIKPSKCQLFRTSVKFLGHVVS